VRKVTHGDVVGRKAAPTEDEKRAEKLAKEWMYFMTTAKMPLDGSSTKERNG